MPRILIRGGLSTEDHGDVVLAAGEPAAERDTGILKIGDGVSTWDQLADGFDPSALPAEVARAEAAEAAIAANLATETVRAEGAEAALAPLASPMFTGDPRSVTPAPGDNDTSIATTAFVTAAVTVETSRATTAEALLAPKASPALTGTPTTPTPTAGDNTTKIASTAFVTNAVATAIAALLKNRGGYDASSNAFPSTDGSGSGGTILNGDAWYITVAGTLGGKAVKSGDVVFAEVDSPGQTAGNWAILEHDLGFDPAPIDSPTFTGNPAAPTPAADDNDTSLATTAFVSGAGDVAKLHGIPVDGTTDASTALSTLDSSPGTLTRLVIRNGESLYVNTDLTLANIELDVKPGGLIKIGASHTFRAPIRNPGLRTILNTAGTPGVFVPTNQPMWHPIWWGPVNTSDDTATWLRAFAAKAVLGNTGFFTGFNSGQKFQLPTGITRWKDLDIPSGCDVGGVFGGTMIAPTASAPIAYMVKTSDWSGIHDTWVDSHSITGKTLVWLMGQRSYAYMLYGSGSLGASGTFLRIGQNTRTITDGVISGGTTLTSAAQAVFTTADVGRTVTGTGIPGGTTISAYVSSTVVTLSAASTNGAVASTVIGAVGSLTIKIRDIFARGSGDGTGISNEASDIEWSNCWFGVFGRNIDAPYGALMGNGIHTWGATTDGFRGSGDSIRLTNFYSENNGTSTGGWGADMTSSDRSVIDAYYIWQNGNGIKYSTGVSRVVTDGVLNSTTTVTSATAIFSAADVNQPISGTGIPANTTIVSYAADGLSCVMSAAATATASGVSVTIRSGAGSSCTNNVLGVGVFDDNVDTALELDDSVTTYAVGPAFGSLTNGVGGGRRGIHAGPNCTATVRAKGSNKWFTQKLKVDDSKGGLDIELGRKRFVAAQQGIADYTDETATYQTMCGPLPYGYNDEWEGEYQIVCNGSQGSDARVRLEPSALGTGMDGRMGLINGPNASATAGSATSLVAVNVSRLNVAVPIGIVFGTIGVLQEQMLVGKFRFQAGSTPTTDNGNLYLQCGSGTAQGARGVPSVSDAVFNSTTTITSATAAFVASDVGRLITGTGIPANTYIATLTNSTTVVLSQATTSSGSGNTITIGHGQTTIVAADTWLEAVRRG